MLLAAETGVGLEEFFGLVAGASLWYVVQMRAVATGQLVQRKRCLSQTGTATAVIRIEKTARPPKRSVRMPIGILASDPRSTAPRARRSPKLSVERPRGSGREGVDQPPCCNAKQTVNEMVPSATWRRLSIALLLASLSPAGFDPGD
jgi:hypothetical protein